MESWFRTPDGARWAALTSLCLGRRLGAGVETTRRLLRAAAPARGAALPGKRQLLVDVSSIARRDAGTGIQRVVREVLGVLLTEPPTGFEIRPVYATRWSGYRYAPWYRAGFAGAGPDAGPSGRVHIRSGDVFLGLDLAPLPLTRHHVQLGHWKTSGATLYFVVYDLLPALHPEWFTSRIVRFHREWLRTVAIFADGALCISRTVTDELKLWLAGQYGRHVSDSIPAAWFHLGGDFAVPGTGPSGHTAARESGSHANGRQTVLMVGTIEPRKGYAQTLSAFEALWREGHGVDLVIVGRVGWKADALVQRLRIHPQAGRRLFWHEGPPDEMLTDLYATAEGVLVASEGEGFGLPIVEAARHGKPLLVRDIPVFREVAGENAIYFSGTAPEGLASAVAAWLDLIRNGRAPLSGRIHRQTWRQSARQFTLHLNEMVQAADSRRPGS